MLQSDVKYFFVCGYAGSGKTTYSKELALSLKANFVEVSDIVKRLSKQTERSELVKTANLSQQIAEEIKKVETPAVVCGVRQVEILQAFDSSERQAIWLAVPFEIRQNRLTRRASDKDNVTLEETDAADDRLGLNQVMRYLLEEGSK